MPKKKRAESPAPEDLCEGGRCIGVVFEDHRQPVYAVAFWPGASDEPMVAVCGSNRASVYAIVERDISLRQVYVDNDRDESFSAALGVAEPTHHCYASPGREE